MLLIDVQWTTGGRDRHFDGRLSTSSVFTKKPAQRASYAAAVYSVSSTHADGRQALAAWCTSVKVCIYSGSGSVSTNVAAASSAAKVGLPLLAKCFAPIPRNAAAQTE